MIAWHYTTGEKFELITRSDMLLPADIGVEPPELPIVWFSIHTHFEPSAKKGLMDEFGNVRQATVEEMMELGSGLYRLGVSIRELRHGEVLRKAAKMKSTMWRKLERSAIATGANPANWFGHVGSPLPLSSLTVEAMDATLKWQPVGR